MNTQRLTRNSLMLAVLIICSQITIPLPVVPITMQTLIIGILASWLPRRDALLITGIYLVLGTVGLPVFANFGAGPGVIIGPMGGYLFGFLAYIFMTGTLLQHLTQSTMNLMVANIIGAALQLLIGSLWLAITNHLSFLQALLVGFVPFIIPGIIKVYLISLVTVHLKNIIRTT